MGFPSFVYSSSLLMMASFGGISVANSMFACLPCDDDAEIKRKNRGVQKKGNDEGKAKKKENENQNKNKKKEKNSLQSTATLSNKSKKKSQTPTPQPQPPFYSSPPQVNPEGEGD